MKHVLWIGGPPGCGKTTIATRLARRHGLRLYSADWHTWTHRDRARAAGNPSAHRWESLTPAERWDRSTPAEMFEMSLHAERASMVIDDLSALPASPLIVAEGSVLPAWAVSSGIADRSRAVWLLPTAAFQRAQLAARETARGHTHLYLLLGEVIEREARTHGAPTLSVDESKGIAETEAAVEGHFGDALVAGPSARTAGERRALLREMNEAAAGQVLDYYAHPWAEGDAERVVREFACECGDSACSAGVRLPVAGLAAGPALAPGHSF